MHACGGEDKPRKGNKEPREGMGERRDPVGRVLLDAKAADARRVLSSMSSQHHAAERRAEGWEGCLGACPDLSDRQRNSS
uniref:Uncharacterized protein n=1 Tax=Knipowitschia caucasica TaxID=637954 RepID=A0AAV2L2S3_KNICA